MKKAVEVLKRELQHVNYLLDQDTGWVLTEVECRDKRDAKIGLKEDTQKPDNWNPSFWESGDLDDTLQVGMIVAGEWWDGGLFKIEEAYTLDELNELQRDITAAIAELEGPKFYEVRFTGGETLAPVVYRNLKEAVLTIHNEMDEDYEPDDSVIIFSEDGTLVYTYNAARTLLKHKEAEYLTVNGNLVETLPDQGSNIDHPAHGKMTRIFPV